MHPFSDDKREHLNKYDRFIPAAWKRLFAFLDGINRSTKKDLRLFSQGHDSDEPNLEDIAETLAIEVFKTALNIPLIDSGSWFFSDLSGLDVDTDGIMRCLGIVADSISDRYKSAMVKLGEMGLANCLAPLALLERECDMVSEICACSGDDRELFNLTSGRLFNLKSNRAIPFEVNADTFYYVLQAFPSYKDNGLIIELWDGDSPIYYEYDNWSIQLEMAKNHGMSAYAFLERVFNPRGGAISADWSGYKQSEPSAWVSEFLWKDFFGKAGIADIEQTPVRKEAAVKWGEFIGRPVFKNLITQDNLARLIRNEFKSDPLIQKTKLAGMTNVKQLPLIKELYSLALSETNYLLRNRLCISNSFRDKEEAGLIRADIFQDWRDVEEVDKEVVDYFYGSTQGEKNILYSLQMRIMKDWHGMKCEIPETNSDIVRDGIDLLIQRNEEVKSILRMAIEDIALVSPAPLPEAGGATIQKNISMEALELAVKEGKVDGSGTLLVKRAVFARWLVAKEFVRPDVGWKAFSYNELSQKCDKKITELTGSLDWSAMNIFKEVNDETGEVQPLSPRELRKAFADGDRLGGKRLEIFKKLVAGSRQQRH